MSIIISDSSIGEQNEFATLWLERTILKIRSPLPGILRWFPVDQTQTFNVSREMIFF